jgi:hypothetical protein
MALKTAMPNWAPGDTLPRGGRTLRVVSVRDEAEQPLLVVEELPTAHAAVAFERDEPKCSGETAARSRLIYCRL